MERLKAEMARQQEEVKQQQAEINRQKEKVQRLEAAVQEEDDEDVEVLENVSYGRKPRSCARTSRSTAASRTSCAK